MNAIRDGTDIRVYDAYLMKESIKEIPGHFYDPDDKAWVVPYSKENIALLILLGAGIDDSLKEEEVLPVAGDEVPMIPMPIKAKPYQHQIRAYNFALKTFGIR